MRIVFAPDSFKGSLPAAEVAHALADGWLRERPSDHVAILPMADGGEGTLAAFAESIPAAVRMPVTVTGPDDRAHRTWWALLPDGTGVVELASTSGIELLGGQLRPWTAHTRGFGQAIVAALDHGVERLVVGIGSSGSTDGGSGLLEVLGARLVDHDGGSIPPGAAGLSALASVDLSELRATPPGGVDALTDVSHPLTGPDGAAAVFGAQKGLTPEEVPEVDRLLARYAGMVGGDVQVRGGGAAGGTGFALARWGARLVSGASSVAELIGLPRAIGDADIVVTGEGSFDAQSAAGKVPVVVADLAHRFGARTLLVAGRVAAGADTSAFVSVCSLTALAGDVRASLADPGRWLRAAGAGLARSVSERATDSG